jgi:hypothetical protein
MTKQHVPTLLTPDGGIVASDPDAERGGGGCGGTEVVGVAEVLAMGSAVATDTKLLALGDRRRL